MTDLNVPTFYHGGSTIAYGGDLSRGAGISALILSASCASQTGPSRRGRWRLSAVTPKLRLWDKW